MPLKPEPFARQLLTEDLLTTRTPGGAPMGARAVQDVSERRAVRAVRVDKHTVVFPGFDGGAEWGGQAFDPQTGLYYVNANDLAWTGGLAPNTGGQSGRALYLQHCASCHRDDRPGTPPQMPSLDRHRRSQAFTELVGIVRKGGGRMAGFPALEGRRSTRSCSSCSPARTRRAQRGRGVKPAAAHPLINNAYRFTGYRRFLDPDGYPAIAPPWGTLSAINLNTGEYAWKVPLGEYPELVAQGLTNTGSENYGGPVVTAGGLVFIGATNHDRKIRAFDKATGALLWETTMPSSGNATPAVYEVDGRQFVAVSAGGGKSPTGGPGGVYVAYALRK